MQDEPDGRKNLRRAKRSAALSLLLHVSLLPVFWLTIHNHGSWPAMQTMIFYGWLLAAFTVVGLVLLFSRRRKTGIRKWFVYNFVGTGNLVYGTAGILLFIFVHPEYTIILILVSLFIGYWIEKDIFTELEGM